MNPGGRLAARLQVQLTFLLRDGHRQVHLHRNGPAIDGTGAKAEMPDRIDDVRVPRVVQGLHDLNVLGHSILVNGKSEADLGTDWKRLQGCPLWN